MGSLQGKRGKRGSSIWRSLDYPLNLFLSTDYRDEHFNKTKQKTAKKPNTKSGNLAQLVF